jgi:hypothetical protein
MSTALPQRDARRPAKYAVRLVINHRAGGRCVVGQQSVERVKRVQDLPTSQCAALSLNSVCVSPETCILVFPAFSFVFVWFSPSVSYSLFRSFFPYPSLFLSFFVRSFLQEFLSTVLPFVRSSSAWWVSRTHDAYRFPGALPCRNISLRLVFFSLHSSVLFSALFFLLALYGFCASSALSVS